MVSTFRGLNEVIQMRKGSGVIMDWKQSSGSLLVGGDSRVIRVWDAHTETQVLVSATSKLSLLLLIIPSGLGNQCRQSCYVHDV